VQSTPVMLLLCLHTSLCPAARLSANPLLHNSGQYRNALLSALFYPVAALKTAILLEIQNDLHTEHGSPHSDESVQYH